ncbi:hypothetical protein ACE1TH_00035 [Shouchella sp. JSM 1781072]|nr:MULTISPECIES: hypothetical protein [Bacillaceae]UTR05709.1 hypothetical protein MM326_16645 [Alkalihalobacillus sp. LMS6]
MKKAFRLMVLAPVGLLLGMLLLPAFLVTDVALFSQFIESIIIGNQKS